MSEILNPDNDPLNPLNSGDPVLTDQAQSDIIDEWNKDRLNPPSLQYLTKVAFGKEYDHRSKEARLIKKFIKDRNLKVQKGAEKVVAILPDENEITLTEDQKEFIENHCDKMNGLEIARALFERENLASTSEEVLAVIAHLKTLHHKSFSANNSVTKGSYKPPQTVEKIVALINKETSAEIIFRNISSKQKKDCKALISYLSTRRFRLMYDDFESDEDKDLFESIFVRSTYDKNDLSEAQQDAYARYACEVVRQRNLNKQINILERQILENNEERGGQIYKGLADALKDIRADARQSEKTQQDLIKDLDGSRAKLNEKREKDNASLLNFVDIIKQEDSRKQFAKVLLDKREKLAEEFDKIESMEDIKCKILGISREDILYGG